VAANGDVANKVGTYAHALAAAAAGIPFLVAGPCSTIDPDTPTGDAIVIEQRDPDEVAAVPAAPTGVRFRIAPSGSDALNPAFDVTPAALVTALITEVGVARPVHADGIARLLAPVPVGP
jgi:methylthioribose-1-phosphate isomerase